MRVLDNISSLSIESFVVAATKTEEKLKEQSIFSHVSLWDLTTDKTHGAFILSSGESSVISLDIIWYGDNSTTVIKSNMFDSLNASRKETEVWKRIAARLTDLNIIFDEENHERDDWKKYFSTSQLLVNVLQHIKFEKFPLIGIANDGQVGASWHGGHNGDVLFILPRDKSDISVSYVDAVGKLSSSNTTLDELEKNKSKAILPLQKELPWYN